MAEAILVANVKANGVTRVSRMRDLHVASLDGHSFETLHNFLISEQVL